MGQLVKNYDKRNSSLKIKTKKIEEVDFCALVFLAGYIDSQTTSILQEELEKLLSSGYINFIFDCENLDSITSNSIGLFTDLENKTKPYGGSLVFYDVNGSVYDVFNVLGFYDYFSIATDVEDAIEVILYKEEELIPDAKEIFPLLFQCPICQVKLKAQKLGRFQCAGCKTIIAVTNEGKISLG